MKRLFAAAQSEDFSQSCRRTDALRDLCRLGAADVWHANDHKITGREARPFSCLLLPLSSAIRVRNHDRNAANLARLAPDSVSGIFARVDMRQRPVLFSNRQWIEARAELVTSVNRRGHDDVV